MPVVSGPAFRVTTVSPFGSVPAIARIGCDTARSARGTSPGICWGAEFDCKWNVQIADDGCTRRNVVAQNILHVPAPRRLRRAAAVSAPAGRSAIRLNAAINVPDDVVREGDICSCVVVVIPNISAGGISRRNRETLSFLRPISARILKDVAVEKTVGAAFQFSIVFQNQSATGNGHPGGRFGKPVVPDLEIEDVLIRQEIR